jgi:hypothetical protein
MSAASHRAAREQSRELPEEVTEQLDNLRTKLQLAPEQQAAWVRFAQAVERSLARVHSDLTGIHDPAPEQTLAAHDDMLNSNLEAIRAIRCAVSELERSLNGAQKRILDEETAGFAFGASR